MHTGLSLFQETSCGHKEKPAQKEFSHDWFLQKCLWVGFIVAFYKPRVKGLHAGVVAAAGPLWWAGHLYVELISVPLIKAALWCSSAGLTSRSWFAFSGTSLLCCWIQPEHCLQHVCCQVCGDQIVFVICSVKLGYIVRCIWSSLPWKQPQLSQTVVYSPAWESPSFCAFLR